MTSFGFLIDNRKCIGCHACTVACKSEHEVPIGVDRTWVKYIEKGEFPNTRRMFTVMRCNHCEFAPCTTICPTTALYRRSGNGYRREVQLLHAPLGSRPGAKLRGGLSRAGNRGR